MNTFERVIKRAFDFTLALVSLIFFSPLIALIALLIKREDPKGDVIYRQERIGYKGKPFTLYKFRSMRMDAEAGNRPQLFTDGDSRLTKVGAFIRAHHLDEFPQLWNVIKGEMSFVGPRPERQFFIDQIMERNPDYVRLYAVRPGSSPMLLFTMGTLIPLRRCWSACVLTSSIWITIRSLRTLRLSSLQPFLLYLVRNSE